MSLPVYSSKDVKLVWGAIPLSGLAPDSFVTFSYNSPLTETEIGADGQVSISVSPDSTGTCTISFQQGSVGDEYLSAVMSLQKAGGRSLLKAPIIIQDPSKSVTALLRGCHIQEAPEISLGSSASGATRDYTFFCESLIFGAGVAGAIAATAEAALAASDKATKARDANRTI